MKSLSFDLKRLLIPAFHEGIMYEPCPKKMDRGSVWLVTHSNTHVQPSSNVTRYSALCLKISLVSYVWLSNSDDFGESARMPTL